MVSGIRLRFSIEEFALISGLDCEGECNNFNFKQESNSFLDKYWPGCDKISKQSIRECFRAKRWGDDDEVAVKLAVLYFVQWFLLSSRKEKQVMREDLDAVNNGCYSEYAWGKKSFDETIMSLKGKLDSWYNAVQNSNEEKKVKPYYTLVGCPHVFQVWFCECCRYMVGKYCKLVSETIPRIARWSCSSTLDLRLLKMMLRNLKPNDNEVVVFKLGGFSFNADVDEVGEAKVDYVSNVGLVGGEIPTTLPDGSTQFDYLNAKMDSLVSKHEGMVAELLDLKEYVKSQFIGVTALLSGMHEKFDTVFVDAFDKVEENDSDDDDDKGSDDNREKTNENEEEVNEEEEVDAGKDEGEDKGEEGNSGVEIKRKQNEISEEDDDEVDSEDTESETEQKVADIVATVSDVVKPMKERELDAYNESLDFGDDVVVFSKEDITENDVVVSKDVIDEKYIVSGKAASEKDFDAFFNGLSQLQIEETVLSRLEAVSKMKIPTSSFAVVESMIIGDQLGQEGLGVVSAQESNAVIFGSVVEVKDSNILEKRIMKPAVALKSPFQQDFLSFGSGEEGEIFQMVSYVEGLFPLDDNIGEVPNEEHEKDFDFWKTNVYLKGKNIFKSAFDFGVDIVNDKLWFHTLSYCGECLTDSHNDVIFYYLRKKGKYSASPKVNFTTTDCFFSNNISSLYEKFLQKNRDASVLNLRHSVAQFIKVASMAAMEPYSVLLPMFFGLLNFYNIRKDPSAISIDSKAHFFVVSVDGLPQQEDNDCGIFVASFVEYFVDCKKIPSSDFSVEDHRSRLVVLLYSYGKMKQIENVASQPELQKKSPKKVSKKLEENAKSCV
ncbi:uncharacterized protein LOC133806559 [Humulus lupulus]|uniref:uncharacterized protein LOC133806559 n=1 Tax=Humulus lupulus TaxID=3486 RepID=UPI002B4074FA|nr:uncharacterized protein LOC133806559 [Humulus lupulus]